MKKKINLKQQNIFFLKAKNENSQNNIKNITIIPNFVHNWASIKRSGY